MIRYRVTFEGDGNGELPRLDYVFRDEALTVGETMLYRPGHWRIMEIKAVREHRHTAEGGWARRTRG